MARRRAPQPPPLEAQREAAGWPRGRLWGDMQTESWVPGKSPYPMTDDVRLLDEWLLRYHAEAAKLAPRKRGRPPKWARMRAAVQWLRKGRILTISDAPGSRCVESLGKFLDQTRTALYRGEHDSTAAELAGTLRALLCSVKRSPGGR